MNRGYFTLNNQCEGRAFALTSNTKFLPLDYQYAPKNAKIYPLPLPKIYPTCIDETLDYRTCAGVVSRPTKLLETQ